MRLLREGRITAEALTASCLGVLVRLRAAAPSPERWAVYYSNQEPTAAFAPYSFLIFDSRYHPPLAPLVRAGKQIIGYVSLGEAAPDYSYYEDLRSKGLLVKPSPAWKGNWYIDIRDPRWAALVCDRIVPSPSTQALISLYSTIV